MQHEDLANLFVALRRPGREVQLCAMLAHVLTHGPCAAGLLNSLEFSRVVDGLRVTTEDASEAGRADIRLETDAVSLIIEAKIFAAIKTHAREAGSSQLDEYCRTVLAELAGRRSGCVVVIEPWRKRRHTAVLPEYEHLIRTMTWDDVARIFRQVTGLDAYQQQIVGDFITMLERENLASMNLSEAQCDALKHPALGDALTWAYSEVMFLRSVIAEAHESTGGSINLNRKFQIQTALKVAGSRLLVGYSTRSPGFFLIAREPKDSGGRWEAAVSVCESEPVGPSWHVAAWARSPRVTALSARLSFEELQARSGESGIRSVLESWALEELARLVDLLA